jgi:hypothetical protein
MSDHAGGTSELREVRATFANPDQMQNAVSKLSMSGFDRAEMSLPTENVASGQGGSLGEASKPASTEEDARQARILGSSTAGSAAALAAAGITIATGGAAAPAAYSRGSGRCRRPCADGAFEVSRKAAAGQVDSARRRCYQYRNNYIGHYQCPQQKVPTN